MWIKNKNKRNNHLNGTELNSFTSKALNNPALYVCHLTTKKQKQIMMHHSYVMANSAAYLFHNSPNPS
jgi:hypothetical protein